MAFQNITFLKRLSDLLIGHYINNYNNDDANITPSGVIPFGSIVFRAKGLSLEAPWAVVTKAADIATTNEFAVVLGDGYGFRADFTPSPIVAKRFNAIVIKRGPVELKEYYIKEVHQTQLGASYGILKQLLADQGLVVLDDVTNFNGAV